MLAQLLEHPLHSRETGLNPGRAIPKTLIAFFSGARHYGNGVGKLNMRSYQWTNLPLAFTAIHVADVWPRVKETDRLSYAPLCVGGL